MDILIGPNFGHSDKWDISINKIFKTLLPLTFRTCFGLDVPSQSCCWCDFMSEAVHAPRCSPSGCTVCVKPCPCQRDTAAGPWLLTTLSDHGISGPASEAGKPKLYEPCHGFQHVNYFTFRDNYAHIAVCFCARAGSISHTKMLMEAKLVGSLLIFWKEIYVPPVWMLLLPPMKSLTEEKPKRKRKKHHHSGGFLLYKKPVLQDYRLAFSSIMNYLS